MNKLISDLLQFIEDLPLAQQLRIGTSCKIDSPSCVNNSSAALISVFVYPLGFSQTASSGDLSLVFYFAIELRARSNAFIEDKQYEDFISLGEELAQRIHRVRFGDKTVYFSKNITINTTLVLENSNRRIKINLNDRECSQVFFCWANNQTAKQMDAESDEISIAREFDTMSINKASLDTIARTLKNGGSAWQ